MMSATHEMPREVALINERDDRNRADPDPHSEHEGGSFGWIAIAAASAVLFIGVGYPNTFGVFADHYQHLFPAEQADKIILIGSVAASLYFILGAFTGRFADVVGYRTSLFIGAALMIGSSAFINQEKALFGLAPHMYTTCLRHLLTKLPIAFSVCCKRFKAVLPTTSVSRLHVWTWCGVCVYTCYHDIQTIFQ